jgi:hypothetical protein
MKSDRHKNYTVNNNVNATHNLLNALVETGIDAHLVHLGTMGVYGYSTIGAAIPEGYLPVGIETLGGETVKQDILYPCQSRLDLSHDQVPGSAAVPVLRQERRAAHHRPAPGHRLGHAYRRRPAAMRSSSTASTMTATTAPC